MTGDHSFTFLTVLVRYINLLIFHPEAEVLDEIQTKFFSLLFTRTSLQLFLEISISSNSSRNLLQFV
jgi:hypothetical protein